LLTHETRRENGSPPILTTECHRWTGGLWHFNLRFFRTDTSQGYLQAWFANDASSSAAIDLIVILPMAYAYFFREGLRIGWRWY
jgi:Terpene cyclase DEP1